MKTLGYHLIIDAKTNNKEILCSEEKIKTFLQDITKEIKMTPITKPFIRMYIPPQQELKDKWGYSGIIIIAESHIAIHTFPEYLYLSIDVYSCKEFQPMPALEFVIKFFEITEFESRFLIRGNQKK